MATHVKRGDDSTNIKAVPVGAVVRLESSDHSEWSAQVSYVNDRVIGLRGWTIPPRNFRERDTVYLLIGGDDLLSTAKAQIISTSGCLMRIVRRDADDDVKRRRAPHLRVDIAATLTPQADDGPEPVDVEVLHLSPLGCALRCTTGFMIGTPVEIVLELPSGPARSTGTVTRTWMDSEGSRYAGLQFEAHDETTRVINRFLIAQLSAEVPE